MMETPRTIPFLALGLASLLLVSCLDNPTDSNQINSLSKNLHIYQPGDQISYTVKAKAFLVEKDPTDTSMILIATQEIDDTGKLKYRALDGGVIIEDNSGTEVVYRNESGDLLSDEYITGRIPLLNCTNIDNIIDEPCIEEVFLAGSLSVLWTVPDSPFINPVSATELSLMKETWVLSLTLADTTPRITTTNVRYISQATEGDNKGELFVHAYGTSTPSTYDWVSVVNENLNPISEFEVAKAISDPSPINVFNGTVTVVSYINENCDAAADIADCLQVAKSEKFLTYQLNSERRTIGTLGTFSTQVYSLSGRISRTTNAVGAVDLGYDIFSNCNEDIPGVTFERNEVSYQGSIAMFPDVGALELNYTCTASYSVTYTVDTTPKTTLVGTSLRIDAIMLSTNITYSR